MSTTLLTCSGTGMVNILSNSTVCYTVDGVMERFTEMLSTFPNSILCYADNGDGVMEGFDRYTVDRVMER